MSWALWFSLLVTVVVGAVFAAMIFETVAFATGRRPITWFTRRAISRWPIQATLLAMVAAALWAHFFWDQACS